MNVNIIGNKVFVNGSPLPPIPGAKSSVSLSQVGNRLYVNLIVMMFRIGNHNDLYIDCAPSCTYHIGGDELDIVADTMYELVNAGLVDKV